MLSKFRIRNEAGKSKTENLKKALNIIELAEKTDDLHKLLDKIEKKDKELYEKILKSEDYQKFEERLKNGKATKEEIERKFKIYKEEFKNMEKPTSQKNIGGEVKKKWRIENVHEEDRKDAESGEWLKADIEKEEWRDKEIQKHKEIREKAKKKKEESAKQAEEGVEKIEKSEGSVMDIKEAKQAGEELKAEVEHGAEKIEETATELFEEAQAMEAEQKFAKTEKAEAEMGKETARAEAILEMARLREELDAARGKFALARPKSAKTEAEIFAETLEKKGGLSPFEFGKKFVEEKPEISAEYEEIRKNYESRRIAMVNFLIDTKRATLGKRGLAPEDIEKELDKYSKEYLAPNFACAEAAKIQSAREEANPSFIEKMKDNKIANIIYGAVDQYRKASFKDKMLLSVGLVGTGLAAGVFGGTIGTLVAGGVAIGKIGQRVLGAAGTAVGAEALIQRSQQKWLEKEGWGKNRKEYIAKQIAVARNRIKAGKVEEDRDSYEHARQKMELLLSERRDLLKKLGTKRTIIGASVGLLVGTGVVFRGVRYLGDIVGLNERLSDFFSYKGEMPKMPATDIKELPTAEIEALHIDAAKENIEHLEGLAEHPADAPNISESENMIYNLVDQDKVAEYEKEMKPYIDTIAEGLKEKGFSAEEIMAKQDEIVNSVIAEMKNRGITIDESALNAENLQKIMESPEGKMGAIISKLANIEQRDLNSIIARMGGWDEFLNSNVSALFEPEGGPIDISLSKFGMELKRLTGDAPSLYGAASIKEILKSINSKEVFGGSAEELIKKGM